MMMHQRYEDILSRIAEPPSWWDFNGTPRYGEFHPDVCPAPYYYQVALLAVKCPHCGRKMRVQVRWGGPLLPIPEYGPPPWHECSGEGDDFRVVKTVAVLQVWERRSGEGWRRWEDLEDLE